MAPTTFHPYIVLVVMTRPATNNLKWWPIQVAIYIRVGVLKDLEYSYRLVEYCGYKGMSYCILKLTVLK